jgi:hypothetical protein
VVNVSPTLPGGVKSAKTDTPARPLHLLLLLKRSASPRKYHTNENL